MCKKDIKYQNIVCMPSVRRRNRLIILTNSKKCFYSLYSVFKLNYFQTVGR